MMLLQFKVKLKDNYHLNIFLDSVELSKKIHKQLGFHLNFTTADLQDIVQKTLGDDIKVNFDISFLYVPVLIPNAGRQIMLVDSIKNSLTLSLDSWSTGGKTDGTHLQLQVDIGSAQKIISPKYLIVAHQTAARIGVPN